MCFELISDYSLLFPIDIENPSSSHLPSTNNIKMTGDYENLDQDFLKMVKMEKIPITIFPMCESKLVICINPKGTQILC